MLNLDKVTFIIVDCVDYQRAKKTLEFCNKKVNFKVSKILTHFHNNDFNCQKIREIKTKLEYSHFCIKDLNSYFETDFVLLGQYDGYVLHENLWDNEFYKYDYIGAPWPDFMIKFGPKKYNVGNGGFSLRSKKLQNILQNDPNIILDEAEDVAICRINRPYLETEYGIKFAPYEIAEKFSFEYVSYYDQPMKKAFGVHNFSLPPDYMQIA